MIYELSLELQKTKRRGIWLIPVTLLLIITAWAGYSMNDERFLEYGWLVALFNAPLLNAILIPTAIAVLASRVIDLEHRGNTWKMLETLQSRFDIYIAKVLYGFFAVLIFSFFEMAGFLVMGYVIGFKGDPDLWAYGLFFVQTLAISFNLYLLQMIISLIFSNQAVALCTGLCGSMAGLFLMYVPQWRTLRNLVPWGHFGASMFVAMDAAGNRVDGFHYMNPDNGVLFFIAGWFFLLMTGGWFLFQNMDTDGYHFRLKRHGSTDAAVPANTPLSRKRVRIPRMPVELIKIRRAPVWIAFLILPLISALIGTANYQNNLAYLKSTWYSLWTQHSLFFCYFFMPPLIGVYASYLWRLEHSGSNWNMVLVSLPAWRLVFSKIAVCSAVTLITLVWLCFLYIVCGLHVGLTAPIPGELAEWIACGVLGGTAVCAAQCFLSLVIRSFAIPIGIGLLGGFIGLAAVASDHCYLVPYSLMSLGMRANNPDLSVDLAAFVGCSVFFVVLFFMLSVWHIKSHDVKTQ